MIFEKKNIFLPEITSDTVFRKDLELEGNLPEDAPDVAHLIRVDARTGAAKANAENGKLAVSADAVFGILYESDYRARPAFTQTGATFTQQTDIPVPAGEYYIKAAVRCAYLTCKLLGPRRYVIRAAMETRVTVTEVKEHSVCDPQADNGANAFFRTAECVYTLPCRTFTEERAFEGVAMAPSPVAAVLFTDHACEGAEYVAGEGRLTVHGEVTLKAFCESEENGFFVLPYAFDAALTVEDADISSESVFDVSLYVTGCSASAESDEYGEMRAVRFNCTVALSATAYEKAVEVLASDAFCGDRECETVSGRVTFDDRRGEIKREFVFEKTFDTEKTDLRSISDVSADFSVNSAVVSEGALRVTGAYNAYYLAETDGGLIGGAFGGEFDEAIPLEPGVTATGLRVVPGEMTARVSDGENITLRGKAYICTELYEKRALEVLRNAESAEETLPVCAGLRFYYPQSGETAWDIARRYHKDPAALSAQNPAAFTPEGSLAPGTVFVAIK